MAKLLKKIFCFIFTCIAIRKIGSFKGLPKVNFYTHFTKFTHIGRNCHFNGLIIRGNGVIEIGDNFHSGKGITMINSYHKYNDANAIPYDTAQTIDKPIFIRENVWIGDRVIILGGVTISEGAIIQAGAVVIKDIPKYAIAGGNPAKVFAYRDIEQYLELKNKKAFC